MDISKALEHLHRHLAFRQGFPKTLDPELTEALGIAFAALDQMSTTHETGDRAPDLEGTGRAFLSNYEQWVRTRRLAQAQAYEDAASTCVSYQLKKKAEILDPEGTNYVTDTCRELKAILEQRAAALKSQQDRR